MVGSVRAWSRAIWMSVDEGSMAVMDAARVGVIAFSLPLPLPIVLASDSAKIPPPHPTSK